MVLTFAVVLGLSSGSTCMFAKTIKNPQGSILDASGADPRRFPPWGRCTRENCKYLHPPPHLKTQLEINGRNNLIQQKTAAAMFAQQMQFMLPGAQLQPIVCREFQRGNCTRGENDCRYAHPIDIAMIDTNENTVTVCMDYIKGRCSREKCKYFHPPAHLQAKIKAAQHQVNQTAAAAMALPPGALQPLPKRPALEKNNGATTVFNPSVFHYQQALANMQLQQPTFIPTGRAGLTQTCIGHERKVEMLCSITLCFESRFSQIQGISVLLVVYGEKIPVESPGITRYQ
ncbi:hypothetical protein DUI87_15185 [Hirundo rustica rustica]|uniref:C3H1-type domain-containing protein n=1 Tax=Hirundo rustica rustica TaxID=333673 RepID=A0A3M0K6J2_HIRRU|nr:hypothetical protein DUI87_15185 [Hirundo rustica rustica]